MEVKRGYKQTEIGVVPEEWEFEQIARLESRRLVKLGRGQVISRLNIERTPGEFPIYSSSVHNEGEFGRYGYFMFDEELITWSIDGGGNFFWRPKHKFSVTNVCGFMRVDSEHICYAFLAAVLQLLHGRKSFDYQSKAHPSVIRKEYAVPLPALAEQRAIAAALSDVDALLGGLDRLIAKKRDLKQAAMQQLLTGQTRLPGFSGAWEVKTLGELLEDIGDGATPSTADRRNYGGGIHWVVIDDIKDKITTTETTLTQRGLKSCAATLWAPGTLVVSTGATIGQVGITQIPVATKQGICGLVVDRNKATTEFLKYWLVQNRPSLVSKAQGSTIKEVRAPTLVKFEVLKPSVLEQAAIAAVLSDMDAELAALEARRDKIRDLKQAMMQELLTGKTRLTNPEAAHA